MEIKIEALSKDRMLVGFSYNRGSCTLEKENDVKNVLFHEFGIGLLFVNIHITFIEKGEN